MWEQKEMDSLKDIKEVEKTEFDDGLDSWGKVKDGGGCLTIFLELLVGRSNFLHGEGVNTNEILLWRRNNKKLIIYENEPLRHCCQFSHTKVPQICTINAICCFYQYMKLGYDSSEKWSSWILHFKSSDKYSCC